MPASLDVQPGTVFGFFAVVKEAEKHKKANGASVRMFECLCKCGTVKTVRLSSLTSGTTVSCGCFHKEQAGRILKAAATKHGKSGTQIYFVWQAMIDRCHKPSNKSYHRYGARGIRVCQRWRDSFEAFDLDLGPRPPKATLERIDNNGHYEPGNVRWATYKEQSRNTRSNHLHTIDGETRCLAEWCEILNEPWTTVKKRIAAGRDPFQRQRARRSK